MYKIICMCIAICILSNLDVSAENVVNLAALHEETKYKLGENGEFIVHTFSDIQVVSIYLNMKETALIVKEIKKAGSVNDIFMKSKDEDSVVAINGGFFGYDKNGVYTPIGLVRSGGKRLNALMPWSTGGVLVSNRREIKILPIKRGESAVNWSEAIQSKPIVVTENQLSVRRNSRDSKFNRIGVAVTNNKEILILGVFHSFGEAVTLVEFGNIFLQLAKQYNLKISNALALDGGPGAHIYIPKHNMHFGDPGFIYVPNILLKGGIQLTQPHTTPVLFE